MSDFDPSARFNEDELGKLLESAQDAEWARRELQATYDRFRAFLEEHEEPLEPSGELAAYSRLSGAEKDEWFRVELRERFLDEIGMREAAGESLDEEQQQEIAERVDEEVMAELEARIQLLARISMNKITLHTIAARKLLMEESLRASASRSENSETTHIRLTRIKKSLQADLLVSGFAPAWQELVRQHFPGEPLDPKTDEDLILEAMVRQGGSEMQSHERFERTLEQMQQFASTAGISFGSEEEMLLHSLAAHKAIADTIADGRSVTPTYDIEAVRLQIAVSSSTESKERWVEFVDHFFGGNEME